MESQPALTGRLQVGGHDSATYMDAGVRSAMHEHDKRADKSRLRVKDKADRATAELVLDPRTLRILHKLCTGTQPHLSTVHGCISTGKEANVYYAVASPNAPSSSPSPSSSSPASSLAAPTPSPPPSLSLDRAVKVYKTSILVFKDRDRYVTGEHRFRRGYCKSNPRKMVKLWAEKEMRNLKRLNQAGIPSPTPLALKAHVLLMTFIGDDGQAAPRLKDAELSPLHLRVCYHQAVRLLRVLYHVCHLVHADLSEYNLLYHRHSLVVIDVGQAVEHDHPHALTFLKKDVSNVNRFFAQGGAVNVLTDGELFSFVMREGLDEREEEEWMERMMRVERKERREVGGGAWGGGGYVDAEFADGFVPRRLDEVADYEVEHERVMQGSRSALTAAIRAMTVESKSGVGDDEAESKEEGGDAEVEVEEGSSEFSPVDSDSDSGEEYGEEEVDARRGEEVEGSSVREAAEAASPGSEAITSQAGTRWAERTPRRLTVVERRLRERQQGAAQRRGERKRAVGGQDEQADERAPAEEEHEQSNSGGEAQGHQHEEEEEVEEEDEEEEQDSDGSGEADDGEEEPAESREMAAAACSPQPSIREDVRQQRKAAKKVAKAAQAEKRKVKVKKKDKQRKKSKAHQHSGH